MYPTMPDAKEGETHVNSIVQGTVLSDGNDERLVVSSGVDRRKLVHSSGQSFGDISSEDTVDSSSVKTLEESKDLRVGGCGLSDRVKLLDDDMGVTNDLSGRVQLLRCGEVVGVGVHESTGLHVVDGHADSEICSQVCG